MAAVAPLTLTDRQLDTLRAVCDTFVPSIEVADDPHGFWARAASDLWVPEAMTAVFGELPEEDQQGVRGFLDLLDDVGFPEDPAERREQVLRELGDFGPTRPGVAAFRALTLMIFYAAPADEGRNPSWPALGYPGPPAAPSAEPERLRLTEVAPGAVLECDVVVIGSGAGGSVLAAAHAGEGRDVVVLEQGGYFEGLDFDEQELPAYRRLYLRGGPFATKEGQAILIAGGALGGGTTVNYTNCGRTPDAVRGEGERGFGLEGGAGPSVDAHLDWVWQRLGITTECSDLNQPHQRMKAACEKLGLEFTVAARNADPATYDPEHAGFMGFGDPTGSKLSTPRTLLRDAERDGARIVVHAQARRLLRAPRGDGWTVEVELSSPEDGPIGEATVHARDVVVAGGGIDTPVLLIRSGIGGDAAGRHLRIHPSGVVLGTFDEPQRPWWGPPQAGLCPSFGDLEDGYGFVVECPHVSLGAAASSVPWRSGRGHKEQVARFGHTCPLVMLVRDRGHGRVSVDSDGRTVVQYRMRDEVDQRSFHRGLVELARLLEAGGAAEIAAQDRDASRWCRGEPLEPFLEKLAAASLKPFDMPMYSGHQMCTA